MDVAVDNPVIDNPVIDNLVIDNPVIDNPVIDNPVIDNLGHQEPSNDGDQAPASRSISSQNRDRKYLTQNYHRDSLIAAGGYSLGSDSKYPGNPIVV